MANTSSGKVSYWAIGAVIVLVLIGFGGYKLWHHYQPAMQPAATTTMQVAPSTMAQPSAPTNKNTSNQQLDSDMQDIQNSMNQLQKDQNTSNKDVNSQSLDVPQQ